MMIVNVYCEFSNEALLTLSGPLREEIFVYAEEN